MIHFAYILAVFWGVFFALFLHFTKFGEWLRVKTTWVATSIGIGVDLLLLLFFVQDGMVSLLNVVLVIALSSIGIVLAGLWESYNYLHRLVMRARGE